MRIFVAGLLCVAALARTGPARADDERICVEVVTRSHGEAPPALTPEPAPPQPPAAASDSPPPESPPARPRAKLPRLADGGPPEATQPEIGSSESPAAAEAPAPPRRRRAGPILRAFPYPPEPYLKRLIEHYVTHERGFAAADTACTQTLRVELYPLGDGWTAFARYSGSEREEKVDRLRYEEFSRFASRVALALLYDRPIVETVRRDNVLDADSTHEIERIRGSNHFVAELGTTIRVPTHGIATSRDPSKPVENRVRILSTVDASIGYRGSFRAWGLDIRIGVGGNASQRAGQRSNPLGGHVDPTVNLSTGLSFFWYLAPQAVNSLYAGLGTRLDVSFFRAVEARLPDPNLRDGGPILGAGLSAIGVLGYELLRTNSVRPFVEASLIVPAYVVKAENDYGKVDSWMPGFGLKFGAMF
ncbi:MAG: hypothetical protein R3F39_10700 [Myxococcota bacterium]